MKCPKCGNELGEGKLLCEQCGEEVKFVPDYDIELEVQLKESISSMLEDMAAEEEVKKPPPEPEPDEEDDIKDELKDYLSHDIHIIHKLRKKIIAAAAVLLIVAAAAVTAWRAAEYRNSSFDYQYGKAVECAAQNNYSEAVAYLERAAALNPDDMEARFFLAKCYGRNGQQQSAIAVLEELLGAGVDYSHRDEVYDMLLGIYENQKNYAGMGALLKDCDIQRIVSKYNKYTALEPEFNKKGGVYEELISITLTGNAPGVVYYTMDGTAPTSNSAVYETPILLESGDYTIRAKFVNMYGVESDIETQDYYINLSVPETPLVNLDSGTYSSPCMIEVYHDNNTKIYYTTDGSVPGKDSSRYIDPIEMPYGISNFAFVAIDDSGLQSEAASRTYHLEIQANFAPELALQVLRNNLWAAGKLTTVEGNVPNKLGVNQYSVDTLYKAEESVYYIVFEKYMDTMGKVHDTNSIYAIDVATADLYKAYKLNEGKYHLQPFDE